MYKIDSVFDQFMVTLETGIYWWALIRGGLLLYGLWLKRRSARS